MNFVLSCATIVGILTGLAGTVAAYVPQEFPPPQGKGRVVVLASGDAGPARYTTVAREIAELGYDVVLCDGTQMVGLHGDGAKADILEAQHMPHALPGKVALVGFSLGAGMYFYYATQWPDLVAGAVLWCPGNSFIHDATSFATRLKVSLLVFASAKDHYRHDCCTAQLDGALAKASTAAGKTFELIVYPDAEHDFAKGEDDYNPKDYADAFRRMADALKAYLSP